MSGNNVKAQNTIDDILIKLQSLPAGIQNEAFAQVQAILDKYINSSCDGPNEDAVTTTTKILQKKKNIINKHVFHHEQKRGNLVQERLSTKTEVLGGSTRPRDGEFNAVIVLAGEKSTDSASVELLPAFEPLLKPADASSSSSPHEIVDVPLYQLYSVAVGSQEYVDDTTKEFAIESSKELNVDIHYVSVENTNDHTERCKISKSLVASPRMCSICGKRFRRSSSLVVHEKRHRNERDLKCELCEFRTYTKVELKRHMTSHSDEKNAVCQYCGSTFSLESSLRSHIKCMHERDTKYACNQCSFTTFHRHNLHYHFRNCHSGEFKYSCLICEQRFQQKSAMLDHMRSHSGDKSYRCELCTKCFACQSRLTVHIKTVHKPREFHCRTCNKMFQTSHHLSRHVVIHTAQRPYQCTFPSCKYACNAQGNLTKHMKKIHHLAQFRYSKRPKPTLVEDPAWTTDGIANGRNLTEQYLAHLSTRLGRIVTLEELLILDEGKKNQKSKSDLKIDLKKNVDQSALEHSYHLVSEFDELLEEELVVNEPSKNNGDVLPQSVLYDGMSFYEESVPALDDSGQ